MIQQRDRDDFMQAAGNFREQCMSLADVLAAEGDEDGAGRGLLLARLISRHVNTIAAGWPSAAPEPAPEPKRAAGKRAPKGQGSHRHKFNENGICGGCGTSRQRRPRGSADAAPPAAPAAPAPGVLPALGLPPNYRAPLRDADEFADGTMGGSGARR